MHTHVLLPGGATTQTLARLLGQELQRESEDNLNVVRGLKEDFLTYALAGLFGLLAETLRIGYIVIGYGRKQFLLILTIEWRLTH